MATVLHLMGPTCAGKSTIIRRCVEKAPELVHPVEVGKMLRAKYGEAHFAGQAAPAHTQAEAFQMYIDGTREGMKLGKRLVLVDGQPRDISQAKDILTLWKHPHRSAYLLVHADHECRIDRARVGRRPGPDLDLAMQRMVNDYRNCYVVMAELLRCNEVIRVVDTGGKFHLDDFCAVLLGEHA